MLVFCSAFVDGVMLMEYAVTYSVCGARFAYLLKSNAVAIISSKLLLSERKASRTTESVL